MTTERKTGKVCSGCSGALIERSFSEYRGDPMSKIFGPGSENQMTRVSETSCSKCGLLYRLDGGLPKRNRARVKRKV